MKNWKVWLVVLVLVGGGIAAFDWTTWYVLDLRVQSKIVTPFSSEPSVRDVLAIRDRIRTEARALWIKPDSVLIDMHVEQHLSNGYALKEDQLKVFWFLVVEARCREHTAKWEQRLDNALPEVEAEALEAGGVAVVRKKPAPAQKP